jgi:hypothetical protein
VITITGKSYRLKSRAAKDQPAKRQACKEETK